MTDVVQCISNFNQNRDLERLTMKYRAMRSSPFVFLRGTCHLFYERLPKTSIFKSAPLTWNCGDLHLENFGSYKGDNRLAYFDMNDFDEAALAPLSMELVRLLTSILVGADSLSISQYEAYAKHWSKRMPRHWPLAKRPGWNGKHLRASFISCSTMCASANVPLI